MFSFDDIVNATSGPQIVSERHDMGGIDWLAGLSDPGEMIACGYMPEARRQAGETDEAYVERLRTTLTPDQFEELRSKVMPAAIRRAGLDINAGKISVMVAGKAPWHNLGVNVAQAVNSRDAARLASIDWTVSKRPLAYQHPVGGDTYLTQEEVYAIVRDDTGACLGSVGSRYQCIQNADGFDFLDTVLNDFGARYESAGAIHGGRKVWMLAHLPAQRFAINGFDAVEPYALVQLPQDGSGAGFVFPTTERVVCANTFRVATRDRGKGISLRHTGDIKRRVNDAKEALGLAVQGFAEFKAGAEAMATVRVPDLRNYVNDVLDCVLDVTAAQALLGVDALAATLATSEAMRELAAKDIGKKIERRGEILADILERHDGEKCGIGGMRGTAWGAFNAVTESADWMNGRRKVGTSEAQASRKLESVIAGDADGMKQVAYVEAMKYVSA